MLDLVLESVRAIVMAAIFGYLIWIGRKADLAGQDGWKYIIAGFGLILFGGLIDITDNFESLNKFVIIGDTKAKALLEKVVGFLLGFCLLAVGYWRWFPAIAARWKTEQRLQDAYKLLESPYKRQTEAQDQVVRAEKLAAIGELASTMAHDLRSPLGAIKNAVYCLKRRLAAGESAQSNPKIGQFLQVIDERVRHSDQIITGLLAFAQTTPLALGPTNLDDVIEEFVAKMDRQENVRVQKQLDPNLPPVLADQEQLSRVFVNLGNNAHAAMAEGGTLTITSRRQNGYAQLDFTDTGEGIGQEDIKRVFNPMFTTKLNGTALGLSICYQIVSQHNGKIDLTSQQGVGTTFTVSLPIAETGPGISEEVTV